MISVKKDLNKAKMSDIYNRAKYTVYQSEPLPLLQDVRPVTIFHTYDFIKYFPEFNLSLIAQNIVQ